MTAERCGCKKKAKPCLETEEHFGGLFVDVPEFAQDAIMCDRCHKIIRDWAPCAPVEL